MSSEQSIQNRPTSSRMPDLVVIQAPDSDAAQAYRSVRETIRRSNDATPVRSILFADVGSRDAAGVASANVAASFAMNGDRTVLVDLDETSPVLHQVFAASLRPGLVDWLSAFRENADRPSVSMPTAVNGLSLIAPGERSSSQTWIPVSDLLTERACQELIGEHSTTADRIIFHGSASTVSSQLLTVAAQVDAVILTVRSGIARRTDAQRAKESLMRVRANILGVVLTED
jgi:protein-tyrosine kinase